MKLSKFGKLIQNREYKCSDSSCDQKFASIKERSQHERDDHQAQPLVCPMCSGKYHTKSGFDKHQNSHTQGFPFSCKVCGKGFSHACYMKRHMAVHSDDRPFKCPSGLCKKRKGFKDQRRPGVSHADTPRRQRRGV